MKTKSPLSLFLVCCLLLFSSSCSKDSSNNNNENSPDVAATKTASPDSNPLPKDYPQFPEHNQPVIPPDPVSTAGASRETSSNNSNPQPVVVNPTPSPAVEPRGDSAVPEAGNPSSVTSPSPTAALDPALQDNVIIAAPPSNPSGPSPIQVLSNTQASKLISDSALVVARTSGSSSSSCAPLPSSTPVYEESSWTPQFIPSEDQLVYFSFDQASPTQADVLRGGGSARFEGDIQEIVNLGRPLGDGTTPSKALKTHKARSGFLVPSQGNIYGEQGSVSMWVKPLGWGTVVGSEDTTGRNFFSILESNRNPDYRYLSLYKYFNESFLWYYIAKSPSGVPLNGAVGSCSDFAWRPNEWSFVSVNWSGNFMQAYVNGNYCGDSVMAYPGLRTEFLEQFMRFGGETFRPNVNNDTLLDDIRVFKRPLKSKEVTLLYQQGSRAIQTQSSDNDHLKRLSPEINLKAGYKSFQRQVEAEVNLLNVPFVNRGLDYLIRMEVRPQGASLESAPLLCSETPASVDSMSNTVSLAAQSLTAGNYSVNVRILNAADRNLLVQKSANIEKQNRTEPWFNYSDQFKNRNVAPFTPPRMQDGSVQVWGRRYDMSASKILPTQIYSQNEAFLQAAPKINFQLEGQARLNLMDVLSAVPSSQGSRSLKWNASTNLGAGTPVEVSTETEVEEDGLIVFTLNLKGQGAALDQLDLELPLNPQYAKMIYNHGPDIIAGRITNRITAPVSATPMFWLGDEHAGLQWVTNQTTDWNLSNFHEAIEVNPSTSGSPVSFKVHLVNQRVTIPASGLKYEFAIHPTPVKPLPSGWRSWDISENAGVGNNGWNPFFPYVKGNADLQEILCSVNSLDRQWTIDKVTENLPRFKPFFYWEAAGFRASDPVVRNYALDFGIKNLSPTLLCTRRQSLWSEPLARDYAVYSLIDNFRQMPLLIDAAPGFYVDMGQPDWFINSRNNILEYDWKGHRELQRNLFAGLKQAYPDKVIMNHQSSALLMPQFSYTDIYVTGEFIAGGSARLAQDRSYENIYSLDFFRAEFAPQKYGIPTFFITEILRAMGSTPQNIEWMNNSLESLKASEHINGLILAHDMTVYCASIQADPCSWINRLKRNFGWDDQTEFVGYWDVASQNLVTLPSAPNGLVVSVFKRASDHRLLFVFFNDTGADATVAPVVNVNALLPGNTRFVLSDPYNALKLTSTQWGPQMASPMRANLNPTMDSSGRMSSVYIPRKTFRVLQIQGS